MLLSRLKLTTKLLFESAIHVLIDIDKQTEKPNWMSGDEMDG